MAEAIFFATLRLFEMDGGGTDRRMAPTGNTVDSYRPMGSGYADPLTECRAAYFVDSSYARAIKFTGISRVEKVFFGCSNVDGAGGDSLRVSIQADATGEPSGSPLTDLSSTVLFSSLSFGTGWNEITFTGANLTKTNSYWVVLEHMGGGDDSDYLAIWMASRTGEDFTLDYFPMIDSRNGGWGDSETDVLLQVVIWGKGDAGLSTLLRYQDDGAEITAYLPDNALPQIKNDESTLYRCVVQIEAVDSQWRCSKDADNDCLIQAGTIVGSSWTGFEETSTPHATNKTLYDDQFGPDAADSVYICDVPTGGDQTTEWNGLDTNIPHPTPTPIIQCGVIPATAGAIDGWESASQNWEDVGVTQYIDQYDIMTFEFWFKVNANFAVDDDPEIRYTNVAGGGGEAMAGLTWRFIVVSAEEPDLTIDETDAVDTTTVTDVVTDILIPGPTLLIDESDAVETVTVAESVPRPDVTYDTAELITTPSYDTAPGAVNYRVVVAAGDIDFDGEQMRVVLLGDNDNTLSITGCSLGLRDVVSEDYEVAAFQKITFDGQDGIVIPIGGEVFSDWIDFPCDEVEDYLVHIYINAAHEYPWEAD